MSISVTISPDDIDGQIRDAIVKSAIGQQLLRVVDEEITRWASAWDSPLKRIVASETERIMREVVREHFDGVLRDRIRVALTDEILTSVVSHTVQRLLYPPDRWMLTSPVLVIERSRNDKISDPTGRGMSTTYVTQATCPPSCDLRFHGCYAEEGFVGLHTRGLNRVQRADPQTPEALAQLEADGIAALTGTRRLRAHVVGDCLTPAAAKIVGLALVAHTAKHRQRAWTYTHSWPTIDRGWWMGARACWPVVRRWRRCRRRMPGSTRRR